ncbi:MAG: hypothetical protein ACJAVI_004825 [Candidatus Azotimanducaceae bacterium]|jgi:hypothetical protein
MKAEKSQIQTESDEHTKPLSFLDMLQSTLWAALGVQKSENHKRDFTRGNAYHFIYMGIGFTAFFVCLLIGIVHLVLSSLGT